VAVLGVVSCRYPAGNLYVSSSVLQTRQRGIDMSAWSGGQEHRLRYVGSLICSKALGVRVVYVQSV
jgi:hypothetical protein